MTVGKPRVQNERRGGDVRTASDPAASIFLTFCVKLDGGGNDWRGSDGFDPGFEDCDCF